MLQHNWDNLALNPEAKLNYLNGQQNSCLVVPDKGL